MHGLDVTTLGTCCSYKPVVYPIALYNGEYNYSKETNY
jgi:hypothetical protein